MQDASSDGAASPQGAAPAGTDAAPPSLDALLEDTPFASATHLPALGEPSVAQGARAKAAARAAAALRGRGGAALDAAAPSPAPAQGPGVEASVAGDGSRTLDSLIDQLLLLSDSELAWGPLAAGNSSSGPWRGPPRARAAGGGNGSGSGAAPAASSGIDSCLTVATLPSSAFGGSSSGAAGSRSLGYGSSGGGRSLPLGASGGISGGGAASSSQAADDFLGAPLMSIRSVRLSEPVSSLDSPFASAASQRLALSDAGDCGGGGGGEREGHAVVAGV